MLDEHLAVQVAEGSDCTVVTLSGPLSLRTVPQLTGELGKALGTRGCVVVDLTSLRLGWEPGVAVFADVLRHAGGWPGARMVLFGADGELTAALDRAQVTPTVPLAADLRAASQRVQRRPERVRRHRDLPPDPTAPRAARTLIRQACIDWAIPLTTENAAALVVSELATNAVVHTGTTLGVRVDLIGETVSVSVRDLRPDLSLRLFSRDAGLAASPGHVPHVSGLQVVSAIARTWGVIERPDAKIVWAQLPPPVAATAARAEPLTQRPSHPDRCPAPIAVMNRRNRVV